MKLWIVHIIHRAATRVSVWAWNYKNAHAAARRREANNSWNCD